MNFLSRHPVESLPLGAGQVTPPVAVKKGQAHLSTGGRCLYSLIDDNGTESVVQLLFPFSQVLLFYLTVTLTCLLWISVTHLCVHLMGITKTVVLHPFSECIPNPCVWDFRIIQETDCSMWFINMAKSRKSVYDWCTDTSVCFSTKLCGTWSFAWHFDMLLLQSVEKRTTTFKLSISYFILALVRAHVHICKYRALNKYLSSLISTFAALNNKLHSILLGSYVRHQHTAAHEAIGKWYTFLKSLKDVCICIYSPWVHTLWNPILQQFQLLGFRGLSLPALCEVLARSTREQT